MNCEPTAIRNPYDVLPLWHRGTYVTRCGRESRGMFMCGLLSQTAPEDRCRTCWPTPKETP